VELGQEKMYDLHSAKRLVFLECFPISFMHSIYWKLITLQERIQMARSTDFQYILTS